jgi:hypothetical protein
MKNNSVTINTSLMTKKLEVQGVSVSITFRSRRARSKISQLTD